MPKHGSGGSSIGKKAMREGYALESTQNKYRDKEQPGSLLRGDPTGVPVPYFKRAHNKNDESLSAKSNLAHQTGGMFMVSDEDVRNQMNVDRIAQEIAFEQTFVDLYGDIDIHRPADLQKMRQIFPEFYEKRIQAIKDWGEIQTRLALIKVRGFENRDDFILWTMYMSGELHVPKQAIFAYDGEGEDVTMAIKRGKWNPRNKIPAPKSGLGGYIWNKMADQIPYWKAGQPYDGYPADDTTTWVQNVGQWQGQPPDRKKAPLSKWE